jgi:hypothetical protein
MLTVGPHAAAATSEASAIVTGETDS